MHRPFVEEGEDRRSDGATASALAAVAVGPASAATAASWIVVLVLMVEFVWCVPHLVFLHVV
ncbi:MAG TPA: hypothetical protein VK917_07070 [Ilumatobacter sp.]|nr:hypothetical protein [Ilumatobacter sp.]